MLAALLLLVSAAHGSEYFRILQEIQGAGDRKTEIALTARAINAWTPADGAKDLRITLSNMGNLLIDDERPAEAIHFLEQALKLEPGSPVVLQNMATALGNLHRYSEALPIYQALLRHDPRGMMPSNICFALEMLERYREAVPHCEAYARPGISRWAGQRLARVYARVGRIAEAERMLALSKTAPSETFDQYTRWRFDADNRFAEAIVLGWGRDPAKAEAAFDQLVSDYPDKPLMFFERGRFRLHRGMAEKARMDGDDALKLDPNYLPALALRAKAHEAAGRPKEASADRAEACRRGWTPYCPARK